MHKLLLSGLFFVFTFGALGQTDFTKCTSLEIALAHPKEVRILVLVDKSLDSIPSSIATLVNLEELILEENRITEIPDFVCRMTTLTSLGLDGNLLRQL
ncbi:MAG: hypothetical protein LW704_07005, partial [Cryomorphaceae bacterium]|nr:hypothetical protein [Cryomorphaceae bacterium]